MHNVIPMLDKHVTEISLILYFFMIFGVIASSISGAIRAIEARMDITGAILLAFLNSNAGGTVRDILLNVPVFWIQDQFYIWLTFIVGGLSFIIIYFKNKVIGSRKLHKILIITDAMGIAAFCLAGVEKSLALNQNNVIAIIMGIWTAIGGGVVADIISNRVPLVFSQELYTTVAFLGAVCFLFLAGFLEVNHAIAAFVSAFLMVGLRLYSVKKKLKLPLVKN
ncbi:MAG: trimeric intracellular cation channel family protein [Proteobacteria bacterium]|nr:trimeric intracellular cation channel family protein [Pseudomonadota bacterium]